MDQKNSALLAEGAVEEELGLTLVGHLSDDCLTVCLLPLTHSCIANKERKIQGNTINKSGRTT